MADRYQVVDVHAIPKQLVFTFSAALAAIGIAAVYNGYQWALSLLVAVTAFAIITGQMGDARSVKSQMKWLVIIPVRTHYRWYASSAEPSARMRCQCWRFDCREILVSPPVRINVANP
jgi:hypothetical protein